MGTEIFDIVRHRDGDFRHRDENFVLTITKKETQKNIGGKLER